MMLQRDSEGHELSGWGSAAEQAFEMERRRRITNLMGELAERMDDLTAQVKELTTAWDKLDK